MGKRRRNDANALRRAVSASKMGNKTSVIAHRKFACGEALFERYYKAQGLGNDFEDFMKALKTPLPVTFRTHGARDEALEVRHALLNTEEAMEAFEGAYVIANPSGETRRGRPVVPERAREVMETATKEGLGARQEIVSMLPVMALDPPSGARVLDVCASPGQKTMQLLERVRYGASGTRGVVHANDAHPGRVKTLLQAIDRHCRIAREREGLFASRAFGQDLHFPLFAESGDLKRERRRITALSDGCERMDALLELGGYTHVLADVPCSGDGTIRKDADCLVRWHPGIGNMLHQTQLAIARRCARLLKPGGVMVYSTCTFNPVEDEAVVASLLLDDELSLELQELDGLPVEGRPGLYAWRVGEHVNASGDDDGDVSIKWFETFDEANVNGSGDFMTTMWPPGPKFARELRLERCERFFPQDGAKNTGGFFVAKIRKKDDKVTRDAFCAIVESELATRCDGQGATTSKKVKKSSVEDVDAAIDRLVPAHRVSKELVGALREKFCGDKVFLSIDPVRRKVYIGSATSSAFLDKSCGESVRLASAGVLLFEPSEDDKAIEYDVDWNARAIDDLCVTTDGVNALCASVGSKLPSNWWTCLPTEIDALLAMRGEAIDLEDLSEQTQRQTSKYDARCTVILCLKKKSGEVVFAMPGTFDGNSLKLAENAVKDVSTLATELRRVAKIRK